MTASNSERCFSSIFIIYSQGYVLLLLLSSFFPQKIFKWQIKKYLTTHSSYNIK